MITKVSFRSFKSLREVDIDFTSRLTVLVGPNASGKTSVLQGISLIAGEFDANGWKVIQSSLVSRLPNAGSEMNIDVQFVLRGKRGQISTVSERMQTLRLRRHYLKIHSSKADDRDFPLARIGTESAVMRFDATALAKSSSVEGAFPDATPELAADGFGLASVLAHIATSDPSRFSMILESLRKVIPLSKQVRLLPTEVDTIVQTSDPSGDLYSEPRRIRGSRLAFDFVGAQKVPADQVSEGTLLVLGWLTAVMAYEGRWLFLLDDIDRGLHPKAQRELVGILRKLLEQNPNYQIIATTHSPYLLDLLAPEEVRIVTAAEDGATLCGTLMEHPEFERWKDLMLPGEMWSTVGEEWLRERRTKRHDVAQ